MKCVSIQSKKNPKGEMSWVLVAAASGLLTQKEPPKKMPIVLSPRHEAAIIAYVALYDNCDKARCWRRVGSAIRRHGRPVTGTVYRGHAKSDRRIRLSMPFLSTTTNEDMAELFVEKEWLEDGPLEPHNTHARLIFCLWVTCGRFFSPFLKKCFFF